jgi:hypothetical protein
MAKVSSSKPKKKGIKATSFEAPRSDPWPGLAPTLVKIWGAINNCSGPLVFYLIILALVEVIVLLVIKHPLSSKLDAQTCASYAASIVSLLFLPYLTDYQLTLSRNKKSEFADHFRLGRRKYLNVYLTLIMFIPIIFVGAIVILVPLIWIMPMFYLVFYPVIDLNMGPIEATKYVWTLLKNNLGKIWAVLGGFFIISLFISFLVSNRPVSSLLSAVFSIFFEASMAVLYNWLKADKPPIKVKA